MYAGRDRHRHYGFSRRLGLEPGDILCDAAREQLNRLRQIAHVSAEHLAIPLVDRGAVEPHRAAHWFPDADYAPHQRGFARRTRADDADRLAGLGPEAYVRDGLAVAAGRSERQLVDRDGFGGRRQLGPRRDIVRHLLEEIVESPPALSRGDETPPVGDCLIDRRERTRKESSWQR